MKLDRAKQVSTPLGAVREAQGREIDKVARKLISDHEAKFDRINGTQTP